MAFRLFKVVHPNIALYEDGALTTRKSSMVVAILRALLARTKQHDYSHRLHCITYEAF